MSPLAYTRLKALREAKVNLAEIGLRNEERAVQRAGEAVAQARADEQAQHEGKAGEHQRWRELRLSARAFGQDDCLAHAAALEAWERRIVQAQQAVAQAQRAEEEARSALDRAREHLTQRRRELTKAENGLEQALVLVSAQRERLEEDQADETATLRASGAPGWCAATGGQAS